MNIDTDPKLLDVYGALDALPSLDLDDSPSAERNSMRAIGTDDTSCFSGATGKSFVAPNVGERGQTVSFAVISPDDGDEQMGSGATQANPLISNKKSLARSVCGQGFRCRGDRIRTCDFLVPNQAL